MNGINSEDDELIRNINEHEVLQQFRNDEWNNSEGDELIRNINEHEVLQQFRDDEQIRNVNEENEQTGQGKKRKAESQDVEQEEYYRIQPNNSEDDEQIRNVNEENEQTGQGKKT